jgi:hypothetical protein
MGPGSLSLRTSGLGDHFPLPAAQSTGRMREACAVAGRVEELWRGAEPLLAAQRDTLSMTLEGCRP